MNRIIDLYNNPLRTKEEAMYIMKKIVENNTPSLFYVNYGNYMDNYPILEVNYPRSIILYVNEPNAKEIAEELWDMGCLVCNANSRSYNENYVFIARIT